MYKYHDCCYISRVDCIRHWSFQTFMVQTLYSMSVDFKVDLFYACTMVTRSTYVGNLASPRCKIRIKSIGSSNLLCKMYRTLEQVWAQVIKERPFLWTFTLTSSATCIKDGRMNELRQKPAAVASGGRRSSRRALITELYWLTCRLRRLLLAAEETTTDWQSREEAEACNVTTLMASMHPAGHQLSCSRPRPRRGGSGLRQWRRRRLHTTQVSIGDNVDGPGQS